MLCFIYLNPLPNNPRFLNYPETGRSLTIKILRSMLPVFSLIPTVFSNVPSLGSLKLMMFGKHFNGQTMLTYRINKKFNVVLECLYAA